MIKILHVNSSQYEGGVAEMLVPLVTKFDKGYDVKRLVIDRPKEFFEVTKKIHNDLHGTKESFTEEEVKIYKETSEYSDLSKTDGYNVIVIHDPQPLPLVAAIKESNPKTKIIWRLHVPVDSDSYSWKNLLKDNVNLCDCAVFSMKEYVPDGITIPYEIFSPCIDIYSPKNLPLRQTFTDYIVKSLGIKKNYVVQISRFDRLKGVYELIDTYETLAADEKSDYEWILASNLAPDDPEGSDIYKDLKKRAKNRKVKVLLLSNDVSLNKVQVNALQQGAEVVVHNSIQEGFGLAVTEAMWKRKLVVTRKVGGLTKQVKHMENGLIYGPEVKLLDAIKDCVNIDNEVLKRCVYQARATVLANFTMALGCIFQG